MFERHEWNDPKRPKHGKRKQPGRSGLRFETRGVDIVQELIKKRLHKEGDVSRKFGGIWASGTLKEDGRAHTGAP